MKIGVCCGVRLAEKARLAGFDYWETYLATLASFSDAEFKDALAVASDPAFKPETGCVFFKNSEHRLTGPDADIKGALEWTAKVLDRAEAIGVKTAVVGSGGARRIPEGFSKERANAQFCELLFKMGEKAKAHGITLAIEPLRFEETNYINTLSEGLAVVKAVDHASVRLLADYYHMSQTGEGLSGLLSAKGYLAHVHISNPSDRRMPAPDQGHDYTPFKKALSEIGYDLRMSIEGRYEDDKLETLGREALSALSVFR